MLAFFYSLFMAIIQGNWTLFSYDEIMPVMSKTLNRTGSFLINALGGHFDTLQTFIVADNEITPAVYIATILTIVAIVMVCLLVFKLTKMVFSIFFGGR